jgi:hypothetical protein
MTWKGWAYNMFATDAKPETTAERGSLTNASWSVPASSDSSKMKNEYSKTELMNGSRIPTQTPSGSGVGDTGVPEADKHLSEISNTVAELHSMSLMLCESLDSHNETLDRIDRKTEIVNDKMLAATLKASQITQRSKRSGPEYMGLYQFVDMTSSKFLAVDVDEFLTLTDLPSRATFFNTFCKEGNIIGIQNAKTLTYIGSTWLGTVKCAGRVFGKQEEVHVNLRDGQLTGIFIMAINWGSGGWLKKPPEGPDPLYMTSVTPTVTDKTDALVLRTVLISREELKKDDED